MNSEQRHEHRTCRLFVLGMLGTVVLAFVLVLGLLHWSAVGEQHHMPTNTRARRRWHA